MTATGRPKNERCLSFNTVAAGVEKRTSRARWKFCNKTLSATSKNMDTHLRNCKKVSRIIGALQSESDPTSEKRQVLVPWTPTGEAGSAIFISEGPPNLIVSKTTSSDRTRIEQFLGIAMHLSAISVVFWNVQIGLHFSKNAMRRDESLSQRSSAVCYLITHRNVRWIMFHQKSNEKVAERSVLMVWPTEFPNQSLMWLWIFHILIISNIYHPTWNEQFQQTWLQKSKKKSKKVIIQTRPGPPHSFPIHVAPWETTEKIDRQQSSDVGLWMRISLYTQSLNGSWQDL